MKMLPCLEDEGRRHEPRNSAPENGKGKKMDSSLESSEGMWLC